MPRIHITGASGSGTTTLGRVLSERLGIPHFETDDYFWEPTDPPYQIFRMGVERNALLAAAVARDASWVLSGSISRWSCGAAEELIEYSVWLLVPTAVRVARLRARELAQFGAAALEPNGAMHESFTRLLEWTSRYDTAGLEQRSYTLHEQWLAQLGKPVLRLEGEMDTAAQVTQVLAWLKLQ